MDGALVRVALKILYDDYSLVIVPRIVAPLEGSYSETLHVVISTRWVGSWSSYKVTAVLLANAILSASSIGIDNISSAISVEEK